MLEISLTVIHVRALIGYIATNECTNVKIYFLHTLCRNSDVFRYIFIIFRKLDGLLNTLTYMYKMFVNIIKFMLVVQNWSIRFCGCNFIGFFSGSYKEDASFVLAGYHNINLTVLFLLTMSLGLCPPTRDGA